MTRRGGGGASSKPAGTTKPEQSKHAAGDPPVPPVPTLPREQTFGPGTKPPPAQPIKRENASTNLKLSTNPGGGRRRRTHKHRKSHRKTRRGY